MSDVPTKKSDVLIVGAGPTGLVLALWLARVGTKVRIIEKNSGSGQASRAMAVHARTLEFYRQLGIADDVVAQGIEVKGARLRKGGKLLAKFELGNVGTGISPYPFVLSFPQDEHERLLLQKLTEAVVSVDWNTELAEFHQSDSGVSAKLRSHGTDREESIECQYLVGCDGAHSTVRHGLKLDFPGGTYEQHFFVADAAATGPAADGYLNMCLGAKSFCLVFPLRREGNYRIIGLVPAALSDRPKIEFDDVRPYVKAIVGLEVGEVNWFSSYKVSHRVANHFAQGRVFIAGDAAHVHSPAGGQGMNTGIGDAVNLAWKLAAVVGGCASPEIVSTYEPERISFANKLVATTDQAFTALIDDGWRGWLFRQVFFTYLAPLGLRFENIRRRMFRLVSQTRIKYPKSPLSVGTTGKLHAGDRLPWVAVLNNFAPLVSLDWQIHVYGEVGPAVREFADRRGLPLHSFAWNPAAGRGGMVRDAIYLVRPDGHLGFIEVRRDVWQLEQYLDSFKIKCREISM